MKRLVKFILNDSLIETHLPQGTPLLDYIRKDQKLHGTKEVCREGDCGACTVLLGELKESGMIYRSITSCLTPIGDIYGKHIVTIEGLNRGEGLSPIQELFVEEGASQCGFCTPGFILSLTHFFINSLNLSYTDAIDAMDGNICRCTGYSSIKRVAKRLSVIYGERLDKNQNRIKQLIEWTILPKYFLTIKHRLKEISIPEVHHHRGETFVSGGTDLFVQRADHLMEEDIDFMGGHRGLSYIKEVGNRILIGANTTDSELRVSPVFNKYFPHIREIINLIASTVIRNRASISGNFVNASPIGDISIIMLVLHAELTLTKEPDIHRRVKLRDFFKEYKKTELQPDECISEVSIPTPTVHSRFNFEKVSKRQYLDIASVNSAIQITVLDNIIQDVRISAGGVWAYPLYLNKTSEFLKGKKLTPDLLKASTEVLDKEIKPIGDIRGSAEYKRVLLRQLFYAHFIKLYKKEIKMEDLL